MPRKESATTVQKLLKKNTLYRFGGSTPPMLYVVTHFGRTSLTAMTLRENGTVCPCHVKYEIFQMLWEKHTMKVEDAKEQSIAALRGLI